MGQARVLLIDDDELSRAVLELHLSAAGYEVIEAEDGAAAIALLAAAETLPCDVILSDLQMPGLSGPPLARELRRAAGAAMPLIAMSGSQPEAKRYAGFDGFLLKPFTMEEFAAALLRERSTVSEDPVAAREDGAPVLEEATFLQLSGMMKPAQLSEIFALSLSELDAHLQRMIAAHREDDLATLQASAHAMKGGFSILGARELQALGAMLESGSGSPADQAASLEEIPLAAGRLRRMLTSRGLQLSGDRSSVQETK